MEDISDPDHPRVFQVSRCSLCGAQLDLPAVHFMCNHSYHQRYVSPHLGGLNFELIFCLESCLPDNDTECPNCAREHGVIREIRRNNEQLADQHDVFLEEVREDGFKAVADAFGRGALNWSRPDDVAV